MTIHLQTANTTTTITANIAFDTWVVAEGV